MKLKSTFRKSTFGHSGFEFSQRSTVAIVVYTCSPRLVTMLTESNVQPTSQLHFASRHLKGTYWWLVEGISGKQLKSALNHLNGLRLKKLRASS